MSYGNVGPARVAGDRHHPLLVAAEMLGAYYGIGAYILEAGSLYDLERLFAGVLVLSVLGPIVSYPIGPAERHFLRWR